MELKTTGKKINQLYYMYVKRENGWRGLIQQELIYKTDTIGLKKYLDITTDWMLQLVNTHKKQKKKYSICKESNKSINQLDWKK